MLGVPDLYSDETCLTAMANLGRIFKDNGANPMDNLSKRLQKQLQYTKGAYTLDVLKDNK